MLVFFILTQPTRDVEDAKGLTDKERLELKQKAQGNLFQLFSMIAAFGGLVYTAKSLSNAQQTSDATLKLSLDGQIADRFSKATEMLAEDEPYRHIAGISTLCNLAQVNQGYLFPCLDVLAAFVRAKAEKKKNPSLGEQALTWVGMDANGCPLLDELHLNRAERHQTVTQTALDSLLKLRQVCFPSMMPSSSPVRYYTGLPPMLSLHHLDLRYAVLTEAKIDSVSFVGSDLRGAAFLNTPITKVVFSKADLRGSEFTSVFDESVTFHGADITRANFSGAKGLTWKQILQAKSSGGTILPNDLFSPYAAGRPKDFDLDHCKKHGWGNQSPTPPAT